MRLLKYSVIYGFVLLLVIFSYYCLGNIPDSGKPLNSQLNLEIFSNREIHINDTNASFYVKKIIKNKNELFIISFLHGLYYFDSKKQFSNVEGVPWAPVKKIRRQVEDVTLGESNAVIFITRNKIYALSEDSNGHRELSQKGIRSGSRFSAITCYSNELYLGTTFNGIYKRQSNKWQKTAAGLPREKYSWKEYFWDEISALFKSHNKLFCLTSYSRRLFQLQKDHSWQPVADNIDTVIKNINGLSLLLKKNKPYIINNSNQLLSATVLSGSNILIRNGKIKTLAPLMKSYPYKKKYNLSNSDNIKALFINLDYIKYDEIDLVCKMLKEKIVNGLVVNFKDDTGNLIYGSDLSNAALIGSARKHTKFNLFFKKIKPYDPYIIARLVVFKDYRLFKYDNYKYALWDRKQNKPWQVKDIEYWVDPFADFVVNYNLAVAEELDKRNSEFGIDEIQFDYIRLPSDKETKDVIFRFRKKGWEKYDILENFLVRLTNILHIPFSLDIFGYNGIYKMGNVIGQDLETISKYAPVICPMYYPSHFGPVYLNNNTNSQAYNILKFAVSRARYLAYRHTLIRPYLQAFPYKVKHYNHHYIAAQLRGCRESGAHGYAFWNPGADYFDLYDFLQKIEQK